MERDREGVFCLFRVSCSSFLMCKIDSDWLMDQIYNFFFLLNKIIFIYYIFAKNNIFLSYYEMIISGLTHIELRFNPSLRPQKTNRMLLISMVRLAGGINGRIK